MHFFRFTSPATSPSKRSNSAQNQQASTAASTLPLPDSRSMDWNSLVSTATKAINTDDETTEFLDLESNGNQAGHSKKKVEKR